MQLNIIQKKVVIFYISSQWSVTCCICVLLNATKNREELDLCCFFVTIDLLCFCLVSP